MFSRFTHVESYFSWSPFLKIFSLSVAMILILVPQLLLYSPYNAKKSDYLLLQSCITCFMDRLSGVEKLITVNHQKIIFDFGIHFNMGVEWGLGRGKQG